MSWGDGVLEWGDFLIIPDVGLMVKSVVTLAPLTVDPFEYKDFGLLVLRSVFEGGEGFAGLVGFAAEDVFVEIACAASRL